MQFAKGHRNTHRKVCHCVDVDSVFICLVHLLDELPGMDDEKL
jgi:hypothetical protein